MVGYFAGRTPAILVTDPSMAQEILIRSFTHFYNNEISDMLSFASDKYIARNPFFRKNEDWKNIRKELVPAFSTNRVKTYYPAVRSVAEKLEKHIDSLCKLSKEVDMGEVSLLLIATVLCVILNFSTPLTAHIQIYYGGCSRCHLRSLCQCIERW